MQVNLDLRLGRFLDIWDWKHKQQRKKMGKLDFFKIKNFCAPKHTVKKVKKQTTEWETKFANRISDKDLVSRICKGLSQCNNNNKNNKYLKGKFGAIIFMAYCLIQTHFASLFSLLCASGGLPLQQLYLLANYWFILAHRMVGKRSTDWRRENQGISSLLLPRFSILGSFSETTALIGSPSMVTVLTGFWQPLFLLLVPSA